MIERLSSPPTIAIVAAPVVLSKFLIEWTIFRKRQFEEGSGVARSFTPEDPLPDGDGLGERARPDE